LAKVKVETLITQSLIDRLADVENFPTTRSASMHMYRESLKRDVEWLLNTRQSQLSILEGYPLASASVVNYGLPDIQSYSGSEERDQNALTTTLLRTLRNFEPRILSPRVYMARMDTTSRSLRFHIEGRISFETMEEEITFDTVLELIRGEFEVK